MAKHHQQMPQSEERDSSSSQATERAFRLAYEQHYGAIYRYVLRRLLNNADVPDATAEGFLGAWRRRDALPSPPADLPWLYGVARKIVARQRRSALRRQRLMDALRFGGSTPPESTG